VVKVSFLSHQNIFTLQPNMALIWSDPIWFDLTTAKMMINCLILKCKPKMKLALFFYSRLSCIANCYALPRPRGEQSMPDRPDYLDTGHNQELEEPCQRLLEDLSLERRKTVDVNDSMSISSRYFFTLSAHLPSLCFLLVVIVGLTYKVLLFLLSLSFLKK